MLQKVFIWLNDPANWVGTSVMTGIWAQLLKHIEYCAIAIGISLLIGVPLGLFIGHTGRMKWLVSGANALRAIPTVGLLVLLVVMIAPHITGRTTIGYVIPVEITLVLLGLPPVLAGTYSGVENVEPTVRDAAYGMGMTGPQVLTKVELPNALPLLISGIRSAALQVIATATVAAYVTLGGLGRFIYDGLAQQNYAEMIGGGVLVAALALITDVLFAIVERYAVSPGVSRRFAKAPKATAELVPDSEVVEHAT